MLKMGYVLFFHAQFYLPHAEDALMNCQRMRGLLIFQTCVKTFQLFRGEVPDYPVCEFLVFNIHTPN